MSGNDEAETFWVVSIPNNAATSSASNNKLNDESKLSARQLREGVQDCVSHLPNEFMIPKLRVGTLDALMVLSDDLGKIDQKVEAVVRKMNTTYAGLNAEDKLLVDGVSPEEFVEMFRWNLAKYPTGSPLKSLVEQIHLDAVAISDDLSKKHAKYLDVLQTVNALERKQAGTLMVKPLQSFIDPASLVLKSEFMQSLVVVVPKQRETEFLETYEILEDLAHKREDARLKMQREEDEERANKKKSAPNKAEGKAAAVEPTVADGEDLSFLNDELKEKLAVRHMEAEKRRAGVKNVIPRSAKRVTEDDEYVVYTIVVLRKGIDTVTNLCRQERFVVRPFDAASSESHESIGKEKTELNIQKRKLLAQLKLWCETQFSDVFSSWIHLKALRTFVESVLRFGIPINFSAFILRPKKGYRTKLRKKLAVLYKHLLSGHELASADDDADTFVQGEFYSYVYLSISCSFADHVEGYF